MNTQRIKNKSGFLPTSLKEMRDRGWMQADIILFTGDAYVDHPSFGAAIIARLLERSGYSVAVIPQPNWRDDLRDFKKLGTPRLFFGVTSGNMDSMVNHYTANKRLRSNDAFTPGDQAGMRPDYAVTVYSKILKTLFPDTPVILGGIEASLRRVTHYDYWSDSLKPSVLIDSKADLLVYGMGEKSIVEIAKRIHAGIPVRMIRDIPQTAYRTAESPEIENNSLIRLSSYEECLKSKKAFAKNFTVLEEESNKYEQRVIAEKTENMWTMVNPAYPPLSQEEIDSIYDLPFTRLPHPRYNGKPAIPAFEMIKDSVTIHRGCFGGCSFCTISAHQGKFISSRSKTSILKEVDSLADMPSFKGHITDLGGPSANMYALQGGQWKQCARCKKSSCVYPARCKNLMINYNSLIDLYREVRKNKKIKKMTIGSGIRYDLLIDDQNKPLDPSVLVYLNDLIRFHVSGRLKVAPEHTSEKVLRSVRKPSFSAYLNFARTFNEICMENGLRYQLIPYFISSLPECTPDDMTDLAVHARKLKLTLEQVQDFTPTPMTLASVLFYTEIDPSTLKKIFVPRSLKEKKLQQLFFFLHKAEKRKELKTELSRLKRFDLIRRLDL